MTGTQQKPKVRSANEADMPTYLRKDANGFKFVRPIPQALRSHFGKANFVQRVGKDYKAAKIACSRLAVETNALLTAAVAGHSNEAALERYLQLPRNHRLKKIAFTSELPRQISSLWLKSLDADAAARAAGTRDLDEIESLDESIPETLALIKQSLKTGDVSKFHSAVHQLLTFSGYELEASPEQWQQLTYEVLKSFLHGYKVLAARQEGEQLEGLDLSDFPLPLAASWETSHPLKPIGLESLTLRYGAYLSTQNPKTRSTKLSIWHRFVTSFNGKPVTSITSADIYNFIESRINADKDAWSHKYATGRAKKALFEVFGLAKTHGLIDRNPVSELDVLPKLNAKKEQEHLQPRLPYTSAQLNELFTSDWYCPKAKNWHGKMKSDLGARYWIPLLCLWHGFRVSEATQLQTHDIDIEKSLITIQVSEEEDELGPERSIKNAASSRMVPIHPKILALGFIRFVANIKLHYENGPLFPSALPKLGGKSPAWGRSYAQAFLRHVRDTLGFGNGYGNHSFRHALEDRIRAAKVEQMWPEGLSHTYTGRSSTRKQDKSISLEEGSEKYYGNGYSHDAIRRYISRIEYPEVVLPPTFETWLEGLPSVSPQLLSAAKRWEGLGR